MRCATLERGLYYFLTFAGIEIKKATVFLGTCDNADTLKRSILCHYR